MKMQSPQGPDGKQKCARECAEQMFKLHGINPTLTPSTVNEVQDLKEQIFQSVMKFFNDKQARQLQGSKSFHSSFGSDLMRQSVKQYSMIKHQYLGRDLSWEPENIFGSESQVNKKNNLESPENQQHHLFIVKLEGECCLQPVLLEKVKIEEEEELQIDQQTEKQPTPALDQPESEQSASSEISTKRKCRTKQKESLELKQKVVELTSKKGVDYTSRVTGISKKKIIGWYRFRDVSSQKGRKPIDPFMENVLVSWILLKQREGISLTQRQIRDEARKLSTFPGFRASKGWLQKFYNRHSKTLSVNKGRKYQTRTTLTNNKEAQSDKSGNALPRHFKLQE